MELEEPNLPNHFFRREERTNEFMRFAEWYSNSSRNWTRVSDSILNGDSHYAKCASKNIWI